MLKQLNYFTAKTIGIALASLIGLEISRTVLRPMFGRGESFLSLFLGSLPNFLAAFGIPLLLAGGYYVSIVLFKLEERTNTLSEIKVKNLKYSNLVFCIISVFSAIGLIVWEFQQKSGYLVYDINDIAATLLGSISSMLHFAKIKYT